MMTRVGDLRFDALLVDLDGVLRRWPPVTDLDIKHGLPPGTFAEAAFAPDRARAAITGRCTDDEWRAAVAADLAVSAGYERAAAVVADWTALTGEIDPAVAGLLAAARERGLPVVLVSNATTRLEADIALLGIGDHVDHVVSSARVGVAKPDPRIFRVAAEKAGVAPSRCLFVDDTPANVEAARALGMTALLFDGPAGLAELLT
jgi:putative hydrolase of the HAD superfamily